MGWNAFCLLNFPFSTMVSLPPMDLNNEDLKPHSQIR